MDDMFVVTASAEDVLTVLQRILSLTLRNRLDMQHIHMMDMGGERFAHFSFALRTDEVTMDKFIKCLKRMVGLLDVKMCQYKQDEMRGLKCRK